MDYSKKVLNQAQQLYNLKYSSDFKACIRQAIEMVIPQKEFCEMFKMFSTSKKDYIEFINSKIGDNK